MDKTTKLILITNRLDEKYGYWKLLRGKYRVETSLWLHSLVVADTARMIGEALGLDEDQQYTLFLAGFLHDYAKTGRIDENITRELVKQLGDLVKPENVKLAVTLASHVEAGAQPPPPQVLVEAGVSPDQYGLMADIVALSDAIGSMKNIVEAEKALIYRDRDYWERIHRWKRYLEILHELENRGLRFYTLSYTHYTAPHVRAMIIHTLLEEILSEQKDYGIITYNDGVLVITSKQVEKKKITKGFTEKIVSKILEKLGEDPINYIPPRKPKMKKVSFELLASEEDVKAIIKPYIEQLEKLEGRDRISEEEGIVKKILDDVYTTKSWVVPKSQVEKLKPKREIKSIEELEKHLIGLVDFKRRLDIERITDYLYNHVFPRYLSGTLVEVESPNRSVRGRLLHCYTCSEPLPMKDSYPVISAMVLPVGYQVKFWLPHFAPLKNLDNYTANGKFRICPLCYLEIMIMSKKKARPPLLYLRDYPISTILTGIYEKIIVELVIGYMISKAMEAPTSRRLANLIIKINELGEPVSRSTARRIIGLQILLQLAPSSILKAVLENTGRIHGLATLIDKVYSLIYESFGLTVTPITIEEYMPPEELMSLEEFMDYLFIKYNNTVIYPLASFIPEIQNINVLEVRKRSFEASRTVTIAVAPLVALASTLTGASAGVSEALELSVPPRIIELPHDVYPSPGLIDASRETGAFTPLHLYLYSYIIPYAVHAYNALGGGGEVSREYLRFYSLLASKPLVFMSASSILYRIVSQIRNKLKRLPGPGDPRLGYIQDLLLYVEVVSRLGLEEYSGKLIEILDELVDYLDKNHYASSWSKHAFIAPLSRGFESMIKKLAVLDKLGKETIIKLAAAEFVERIRRDNGYLNEEQARIGLEKAGRLLGFLLDFYLDKRDMSLLRDLMNDIYNYVFIKRYILAQKRVREKKEKVEEVA